jgi:preprotein translocase subunit YajC
MTDTGTAVLLRALDEAAPAPSVFQSFALMIAIVGIMYFILYLPQQREKKKHEALLSSLQKDDRVMTRGGMHGKVVAVKEGSVVVEIADRTHVTFEKSAIADKVVAEGASAPDKK